jgi:16S rRNA (uracil1498-N3)-methyltransferase
MNILIIKPEELAADGVARLKGRRAQYVYEFHGLKEGLDVKAAILNSCAGRARVLFLSLQEVCLQFTRLDQQPQKGFENLEILMAVPRPQILKKVLSVVCELGARRLILVSAERSQKSYLTSKVLEPEDLEYFLIKGLEQSADYFMPEVLVYKNFRDCLAELKASESALNLFAHADQGAYDSASTSAGHASEYEPSPIGQESLVRFAIGPEGGWSADEVTRFKGADWQQILLGRRVLRVDTALAYMAGQLAVWRRG